MLNTTVFLLDIIDSNSLHGPVRELHQDNGISNRINQSYYLGLSPLDQFLRRTSRESRHERVAHDML
jgi:hypothetical protein